MWRRVRQAARLIRARVAGGKGVSVLMEGALCLAISEMRNETKYSNPTFYNVLLFVCFFYVVNNTTNSSRNKFLNRKNGTSAG